MEKGKSAADNEVAAALKDLHLNPNLKNSILDSNPVALLLEKPRPRRLVSLCLGVLGHYMEDIIVDVLDIAASFPSDIKLALVAIARRRQMLNDDILISLADNSWKILDVSGSEVTDFGLAKAAKVCTNLNAVDISRCSNITFDGVSELISHCRSLETLRCGGCRKSDFTARRCLSILLPKLNDVEEESWEELDSVNLGSGAQSLRWLVWPKIDEDSKLSLSTECPRIIINPKPSIFGFRRLQLPTEALASVPLDDSILEDIDPKSWAISGAARIRKLPEAVAHEDKPEVPIAERFRLAFLERDTRLAPKRAKNDRQRKRRAEKEYLSNSTDAKSFVLASQASRFLHHRS